MGDPKFKWQATMPDGTKKMVSGTRTMVMAGMYANVECPGWVRLAAVRGRERVEVGEPWVMVMENKS